MRILILEPAESIGTLLVDLLEGECHEAIHVRTAAAALDAVARDRWDVVLAELVHGSHRCLSPEDADMLRRLALAAPVVLASSRMWLAEVEPAAIGASAILTKPFDLEEVLRRLAAAAR